MSAVDRARTAVVGHGVVDGPSDRDPEPPVLDDPGADRFVAGAVADRVVGLALAAVDAGAVVVPPAAVERLASAQRESAGVALVLEAELLRVAALLTGAGIDLRVLKGPALAHTAYPDPAWREFGDVDLLVRGPDLPRAADVLAVSGYERAFRPVGRRYETEVAKSVTLRSPRGWEIDLHRTVATGPWGVLVDPDSLWSPRADLELGGVDLPTLPPELHLAHALVHVGLGSPTPRGSNLRDLLQLGDGTVDRAEVLRLLRSWSALAPAREARGFLPPELRSGLDWLGHGEPTRRERRWMALHRRSPQPFRRLTIEGLVVAGPSRRSLRYLRAVAPLLLPAAAQGRARRG
ncbi:nucleotidyltransferase family protein [Dermatobacter hominis]|uniref:nucleotidyltransferase family protein n=1 Tax=Dermatobacter hominis TaxID=2884263 RepID=UPI001D0FE293|nr:nucleotidyltransferase family protein [Dermatobacter hominis]UDY33934.1 nucleotidyltransferase family protein [Dermatobacter hominis]